MDMSLPQGYCRLALYDTSPPPPAPPPRFGHKGISTQLDPPVTFDPHQGGGAFLFDGVFKLVELNIGPSFFRAPPPFADP